MTEGNIAGRGRVVGIIPARLASTRLPRKVLRPLLGQPLLAWVVQAAMRCPQLDEVIVAVDAEEVAELCRANGWSFVMTSPALPSGSDRVYAAAQMRPAEIYVNIQADEPMLQPGHVAALLAPFARGAEVQVATLRVPCPAGELANPNAVKVVTAADGRALYFSRATIPYDRERAGAAVWKHLGLYAYRREALERFHRMAPSPLEMAERLEQLRLLENGIPLHVEPVETDSIGVDTEEDLARVEQMLRMRGAKVPA